LHLTQRRAELGEARIDLRLLLERLGHVVLAGRDEVHVDAREHATVVQSDRS
jgi:hypothetical protein